MREGRSANDSHSPSHSYSNGHSPTFSKSVNGHSHLVSRPETNGSSHTHSNGFTPVKSFSPVWLGHDREEVTRILIQGLNELGYATSANSLSRESGFELEDDTVSQFRKAVLDGKWTEAERLLFGDEYIDAGGGFSNGASGKSPDFGSKRRSLGLGLLKNANRREMLFWMRQQKYLELLENRDLDTALIVLRQELTPMHQDTDRLHLLGGFLMCRSPDELRRQAEWDGAQGQSRQQLLSALSESISPDVMVPEHRMANLFDQCKDKWINNCRFHNTRQSPSLFYDHTCDQINLPTNKLETLRFHDNEVWYLAFSNNGRYLATASSDRSVIIFDVNRNFTRVHTLKDHKAGVCFLAWSPDDSKLITCTREQDNTLRVWNTAEGFSEHEFNIFEAPTTAAAWISNDEFIVGSLDTANAIVVYKIPAGDEEAPVQWREQNIRVYDLALSADQERLAVVAEDQQSIIVYDFPARQRIAKFNYDGVKLTSLRISMDSRAILVSMNPDQIREISIDTGTLISEYKWHVQNEFMVRSSFGGASETFVVTGSEDSKIYIWRRNGNAEKLHVLQGHQRGCVNAIAWNPGEPGMFASAGDDASIRIWVSDSYLKSHPRIPVVTSG